MVLAFWKARLVGHMASETPPYSPDFFRAAQQYLQCLKILEGSSAVLAELCSASLWQVSDPYIHLIKAIYFARGFRMADARAEYHRAAAHLTTAAHYTECTALTAPIMGDDGKSGAWSQLLTRLDAAVAAGAIDAEAALPATLRLLAALRHYDRFHADGVRLKADVPGNQALAAAYARFAEVRETRDFGRPVFCIGLSKTGTTSLAEAMTILGYSSAHWTSPLSGDLVTPDDAWFFDFISDAPHQSLFTRCHDLASYRPALRSCQ